mgnify:CR=1 FL=1
MLFSFSMAIMNIKYKNTRHIIIIFYILSIFLELYVFFYDYSLFWLVFCSFLSISGEDLVFLIFFVLLLFNFFKCRGKL